MNLTTTMNELAILVRSRRAWVPKNVAILFFSRLTASGDIRSHVPELDKAVSEGRVAVNDKGKYNLADCLKAANIW